MFTVTVKYENDYSSEQQEEVRQMYSRTRNYGDVNIHFADFRLCDDTMLTWAIELGWDIEAVIEDIENNLTNDLYSDENPLYNFFYEIVNDAIAFIDRHLVAQTE